jgi:lysophospholipase L1-like esterase
LPYLFFFVLLIVVEMVVRVALPYIPSISYFVPGRNHANEKAGSVLFEGDPLLGWRLQANQANVYWDYTLIERTNNRHLRGAYDIGSKTKNTIRILCLGDSVTFGYRVPVCFPENLKSYDPTALPYPILLERELQKKYPSKKIEVLIFAVPGYTSYQGYNWLKRDIDKYDPDLVTLCFGWNDTDDRPLSDRQALPNDPAKVFLRGILAKSQAAIHFSMAVMAFQKKNPESNMNSSVPRVSQESYVRNILAMVELAQAHGAKAIVLGQVYRDAIENSNQAKRISENRAALRKACADQRLAYLQFDRLIETNFPDNQSLFGELIHPNHIGHQLMAGQILTFMEDSKILEAMIARKTD